MQGDKNQRLETFSIPPLIQEEIRNLGKSQSFLMCEITLAPLKSLSSLPSRRFPLRAEVFSWSLVAHLRIKKHKM